MGQEALKRRDVTSGPHEPWAREKYSPYSPIRTVPNGPLKGLTAYDVFLLTDTGGSLPPAIKDPNLIRSHEDRQKHVELERSAIEEIQYNLNELAMNPTVAEQPSSFDAFAKVREYILKKQEG